MKDLKKKDNEGQSVDFDAFVNKAPSQLSSAQKPKKEKEKSQTFTCSMTQRSLEQLDSVILRSNYRKANRSNILRAAIHHMAKLTDEEINAVITEYLESE